MNIQITPWT